MIDQKKLILDSGWDVLIVLDACRYDTFKEIYPEYFQGNLKKVKSPAFEGKGAPTSVWYRNVFTDYYNDIVHVSSHPRVNSRIEVESFKGFKHFSEVVDIWDEEWDKDFGTILPEDMTRRSIDLLEEFKEKRIIVHYMQPHTPYLSLGPPSTKKGRTPHTRKSLVRKIRNFIVTKARNFVGDQNAVKIMDTLGLPPLSPMDDALRKAGTEGVKKAYRKNLERALKSLEDLLERVEGKVVITSDHGELLGEYGRFGHDLSPKTELVEVPWFEVDKE